jgi:predicted O-methyltransferase YrrM
MKFHQSKVLENLSEFKLCKAMDSNPKLGFMRYPHDMFLIFKICEYWQPKKVLEIGFFAGQTLGLMFDACGIDTEFTTVDINYNHKPVFDRLYNDQSRITFVESDSKSLDLPYHAYDFILIDGDHSYESANRDIMTSLNLIKTNGIICVDDYIMEGVWKSINEQLTGQHGWVPFLMGPQSMFFHHESHKADDFLDIWLQKTGRDIIKFFNHQLVFDKKSYHIQTCWIRYENISDLIQSMKHYNL